MNLPTTAEYHPRYQKYMDISNDVNFFELFDKTTEEAISFFRSIDTQKLNYKYAADKWTIKDVLMHIIDTDRGFSYRAIVCIRLDGKTPLYPMDENMYAKNVNVTARDLESLLEEFAIVRKSFRILFENCSEEQSSFLGNGNGHKISARALGYISIGHTKHHLNVIKERYLN